MIGRVSDLYYMKYFYSIFLAIFLYSIILTPLYGQEFGALGIAELYLLPDDTNAEAGDIISIERGQATTTYKLANTPIDDSVVGVVVPQPLILFDNNSAGTPIVNTGQTRINVSTIGGFIITGDVITTGTLPGKGEKANDATSYMIGIALESFPTTTDTSGLPRIQIEGREVFVGTIAVDLKIGPAISKPGISIGSILDKNVIARLERFDDTKTAIQIIIAAMLALGSIFFAFRNFGSSIQNGIISVGRNPKAKY